MSSNIQRFEDLIAWQKARVLNASVYRITGDGTFARDFALRDQIRRASISIMSNIAEGFERGKPSELHQFLRIAKGSCAEVRSQLYAALDAKHLGSEDFAQVMAIAEETGRVIGGLRASVERRRDGEA
jgi:four helix bundle protein